MSVITAAVGNTSASKTQDGQLASVSGNRFLGDNINTFLTLLTTQLRNQDPTSPLDTNEMTQQLVSFANVEQQVHVNQNLESLISLQEVGQKSAAVSYIGKAVEVESDKIANTGSGAFFSYQLQGPAKSAVVNIETENGQTVFSQVLDSPDQSLQKISWTGSDLTGHRVPNGNYKVVISAVDANGNAVQSKVWTQGLVDSVNFSDGKVMLSVAGNPVALSQVQRVGLAPNSNN